MTVETKMMGTVDVDEERLVRIPAGLFGFEEYTDFVLVDSQYEPFIWLQSLQEKNLAFLLIDPFLICHDYEVDVDDKELLKIELTNPADVWVLCVVTVPGDGSPVTANLQGPLIINRRNHQCMQAILSDQKWTVKHNIVAALRSQGGI